MPEDSQTFSLLISSYRFLYAIADATRLQCLLQNRHQSALQIDVQIDGAVAKDGVFAGGFQGGLQIPIQRTPD